MVYQKRHSRFTDKETSLAIAAQAEDFATAGIHSGYRGSQLLGYRNPSRLNRFRRGEELLDGVYLVRLSRLIQWKTMGFDLDVLYTIDWEEETVVHRQGKTAQKTDQIAETLSGILAKHLPLNPFEIGRSRRIAADWIDQLEKEVTAKPVYWGQVITPDRVLGAMMESKGSEFSGVIPYGEAADILRAKYEGCDANRSIGKHPLAAKTGGTTFGLRIPPSREKTPEKPPSAAPEPPKQPKTPEKPPSESRKRGRRSIWEGDV